MSALSALPTLSTTFTLCHTVCICLATGFTLAYFKNYKQTTHPSNPSNFKLQELVLLMKGACFHVHHWMWAVLLVACLLFGRFVNNDYLIFGVCGFLIGMSLEDLLFKDWAVVTNNCHKSQLIEFMRRTEDVDAQYN